VRLQCDAGVQSGSHECIFDWVMDTLTAACMRCRSVSYAGDPERLHRVLHKLIRGDAITVSAVGGSVTGGPCLHTDARLCMPAD
jgi:hypothetical protein